MSNLAEPVELDRVIRTWDKIKLLIVADLPLVQQRTINVKILSLAMSLFAVVIALTLSGSASAQLSNVDFEILPGSTYTYFPSDEGPGIEGCSPGDYQCDFAISGLFR